MKLSKILGLALVLWALLVAISYLGERLSSRDPARLSGRISDLSTEASVSFVIVGDTGTEKFHDVGAAIVDHCEVSICHFAILLRDNFYLWPFDQGPRRARSRAFKARFYAPLAGLKPGFDVWAVLGNHGYVRWARPQAQIKHSYLSRFGRGSAPDWLMPDHVFAIPKLPPWLAIVGFDSHLVLAKPQERQDHIGRIRELFGSSNGWRFLAGHHPLHTSGTHGARDRWEQERLFEYIATTIDEMGIQLILSGHDHDQEFIVARDYVQVVQGAGSKLRDLVRTDPLERGAQCQYFSDRHYGFGKVTVTEERFRVDYFGVQDGVASLLRSFGCSRDESGLACVQESHQGEESGCPVPESS